MLPVFSTFSRLPLWFSRFTPLFRAPERHWTPETTANRFLSRSPVFEAGTLPKFSAGLSLVFVFYHPPALPGAGRQAAGFFLHCHCS
eukprot:m.213267 g.213267  ORF g.213267 m.213267 type:complete len:87 (-) comp15574_c1_seq2:392-652(-)